MALGKARGANISWQGQVRGAPTLAHGHTQRDMKAGAMAAVSQRDEARVADPSPARTLAPGTARPSFSAPACARQQHFSAFSLATRPSSSAWAGTRCPNIDARRHGAAASFQHVGRRAAALDARESWGDAARLSNG
ncbi:hypothetical protein HAX54_025403 [Datura stramonium]|uniref:Uncharacterized protein n=1 Tax=Datura stramonium TaxID=4076 RepID=A0ABS8V115_DATST|nr:hypothetical protein [Datura stramonium]